MSVIWLAPSPFSRLREKVPEGRMRADGKSSQDHRLDLGTALTPALSRERERGKGGGQAAALVFFRPGKPIFSRCA